MSSRPMDGAHTNPFRRSIIARSESPFESGLTHFGNSSAPSLSAPSTNSRSSNPFGEPLPAEYDSDEELDAPEGPLTTGAATNDALPPSYSDVVPKSSSRARPQEKRRPSRDERGERGDRGDREQRSTSGSSRRDRSDHEDSLERERRRLAEREKYYRERRKELERRAADREARGERPERPERAERAERRERSSERESARDRENSRPEGSSSRTRRTSSSRRESARASRSRSKSESVGVKTDKYGRRVDKDGRPLDTIDRMDVTGLFGPGAFHHDGPFDACTPHRNKKTNPRGPVAAFDAMGPNNSLMPDDVSTLRMRQEDQVFGREEQEPLTIDMAQKVAPVHGVRTMGLGSTTFLDGMPASKNAIQQAESDRPQRSLSRRAPPSGQDQSEQRPQGLLGRVKSLRR